MIPFVLPKVNDLKNRLKYEYVFPKANELNNRLIHEWRTKIPVKHLQFFIIIEIDKFWTFGILIFVDEGSPLQ